jgi:ketosteroid isomerase-like protein
MKRLMFVIVLVLLVSCMSFGQAKKSAGQNVVQEITALENAWIEASRQYDVSWFERNLADSYVYTGADGVGEDKTATIANVKNKAERFESFSYEGLKVQAYGDTAVATGISVIKSTYKGKDSSGKYSWTDTWVKLNGHWQCVAEHVSKLPPKQK